MSTQNTDPFWEHLLKTAFGNDVVDEAKRPEVVDISPHQYETDRETVALGTALMTMGGKSDIDVVRKWEAAVLNPQTEPDEMRTYAQQVERSLGDIIAEAEARTMQQNDTQLSESKQASMLKFSFPFYLLGAGLSQIGGLARMLLSGVAITGATAGAGAWKIERDVARGGMDNQVLRYQAQMYEDMARKFEANLKKDDKEERDEYATR